MTTLDVQRQRQREDVRRHRLKFRQRQHELREAVHRLEKQLTELSSNWQEAGASSSYLELVGVAQRLQMEQVILKRALEVHEVWYSRVCEVTVEFMLQEPRVWAAAIVHDAMSSLPVRVKQLQENLDLLRATAVPVSLDAECDGNFGWQIKYTCERGHDFFVSLTKLFPNVSVDVLLQRQWRQVCEPTRIRTASSAYSVQDRGKPESVLNGTAVIRGSVLHCPRASFDPLLACHALTFVPHPNGGAIACVAILQPTSFESPPPTELVNISSWVSLTRAFDSDSQGEMCKVELAAHWRFDTREPERTRITNALQEAVAWETELFGSAAISLS